MRSSSVSPYDLQDWAKRAGFELTEAVSYTHLRRFRVPSRDVLPAGFQHEHGRCRRTAGPFAAIADAGLAPLFRGRQYPSRSFDTPLRPFQMIPAQLKKQSRSSAPAYSNTPPSLRKTLPPGERTQKIPAGKPVGIFFFAGGPSVT